MSFHHLRALASLALVLAFACGNAMAGPDADATSSDTATMPGVLPVSAFARHALLSSPRLSPDGKHLLVRVDDKSGRDHALVVYQLSDMSIVSKLRMPVYEMPLDPTWVSNDWITLEIGKKFGSLDKPMSTGEIIASSIDGEKQRYLFGSENKGRRWKTRGSDEAFGFIAGRPDVPNGHVYIRAVPWGREDLSILYNVNVQHNTRDLMVHMDVSGMSFLVDPEGEPAYAFGTNADFEYVMYRNVDGNWVGLSPDQVGEHFTPFAYTPDHQRIYAYVYKDGGPAALVTEGLDGSQRQVLARAKFGGVGDIQWTSPPERPFAVLSETGVPHPIFLDRNATDAKLYRALQKAFPGKIVNFINFSQDGGKLLFYTSSDRDPGTYYLLNTRTKKVNKLFDLAPWIDPDKMATRWPFHFKASDGTVLEGILTFPLHRKQQNLPMVLIPHGGPYGIKDSWYFDWDAQFLANRGYLVLQVNFRGSGGRGVEFVQSGYRKWGTRIQQDLIDGVNWTIAHHFADPDRICVYGASFGGYSALMTVIRAPDLFQCAIGYAGVYDLPMLFDKGDIQASTSGQSYLGTVLGHDQARLAANSPDRLAEQIQVPVFLAHGKDDKRAPFAGAEKMRAALEAAHKPYEWMAVNKEGHGFYTQAHRAAFMTKMQAFLKKYIGPGTPPTQP